MLNLNTPLKANQFGSGTIEIQFSKMEGKRPIYNVKSASWNEDGQNSNEVTFLNASGGVIYKNPRAILKPNVCMDK